MNRKLIMGVLGIALLLPYPTLNGQTLDKKPTTTNNVTDTVSADDQKSMPVAERFLAIEKRFSKAMKKFESAYQAAKTDKEKQDAGRIHFPKAEDYEVDFFELAKDHPNSEFAIKSLVWIALRSGKLESQATARLLEKYSNVDELVPVIINLQYSQDPQYALKTLRAISATNENEKNRGASLFALSYLLSKQSRMRKRMRTEEAMEGSFRAFFGDEFVDKMLAKTEQQFEQDAVDTLQTIIDKYSHIELERRGNLGKLAERTIFGIVQLSVGKVAPDIVGTDLSGVEFKLSDYRGKIVMLDFWGDW